MAKYLLIETRDPFAETAVRGHYELAAALRRNGDEVTLFLVQNGVLPARKSAAPSGLDDVVASGVAVLGDDFSLRERGLPEDGLHDGVRAVALDVVMDQLAEGRKAIWL